MGMIGNYCKITKEQFDLLKQGDVAVSDFLYGDNNVLADDLLDIDKAWDCIHFVLTGEGMATMADSKLEGSPAFNVVMGGKEISAEDIGYGSARYLTPAEVIACNDAMKDITEKEFTSRYTAEDLLTHQIYPLYDTVDETFISYSYQHFNALQAFFAQAVKEAKYMLLYIN
ncbi:YfbM family protein [Listeria booriae]|uniref:YfbM family protein n=1 Tax=Listeria booriae TaxID=1552123 RepID=A0A842EWP1_9LIST|nr:YfbM family protein [Listeria booriae]MBC2242507.1 YfbM family protein [Listeria booriae]